MKNMFFFTIIVISFISCTNHSQIELGDNDLLKKYFTKEEIKDLGKIIDFYDSIILSNIKTDNIDDAYHKYFSKIKKDFKSKGIPCIDTADVNKLFGQLSNSTIEKIWFKSMGKERKGIHKYRSRSFISLGKNEYYQFLSDYSLKSIYLKKYTDNIKQTGDVSPLAIYDFLINYNKFDFNNKTNKLIFAIHYIILGYNIDC